MSGQKGNKLEKKPSYLFLSDSHFLKKIEKGKEILSRCTLCGNSCKVNRLQGEVGRCAIGSEVMVSSHNVHLGEEPPISGSKGSGTIFLTGCSLSCVFCQNYPISQFLNGKEISSQELATMMLDLQKRGVHNINFVTPTHQVPQIIEGVFLAKKKGFKIPIVYNTNGFDSNDCLELLEDIVDVYLPDFKYAKDKNAVSYSDATNYVETAKVAIKQMYEQVGNLIVDEDGIAKRGILLRHLILPKGLAQTKSVFKIIKEFLPLDIHISVMGQYFPAHKAKEAKIDRKISPEEYSKALDEVIELGFNNVYKQILDS